MPSPRRRSEISRTTLVFLAAAVVVAGIAMGALIPGCRSSEQAQSPPAQPAPPTPTLPPVVPAPVPPASPTAVVVDQLAVDEAVLRATVRLGTSRQTDEQTLSERSGTAEVRWVRRSLTITTQAPLPEAVEIIRQEVEAAGGTVRSRLPAVQVAIARGGAVLVTHQIHLAPARTVAGRVAIIFDDAGGSLDDVDAIIALRRPVAVAVLPGLRFSREIAERARAAGLDVLLHLPLEPEDPSQTHLMGRGGITSAMTDEEIAATVREDLQEVPGAAGINNHMGSKGSADERVMRAVLAVARERRLMFVDSRTSVRTVAARLAQEMGIPTASRAVFLDNEDDADAIRLQIVRLILLAKQRGEAIAIGHAHRLTSKVVLEMLGEFDRQGVELVPITTLVH